MGILACVKFIVELSWFYQISIDFLSTRVKKIIVTKKETKAAFFWELSVVIVDTATEHTKAY